MITSLRLQNFRSYSDTSLEFSEGVNIIVGPNASGKTNILEGLLYVCGSQPFRAHDEDNIKHGESWARLDAITDKNIHRTIKLTKDGVRTKKTFEVDGTSKSRPGPEQIIPTVLFEPNHLQLLTTSPEKRRDFIDTILSQIDVAYPQERREYMRTLAQRNRLLKMGEPHARGDIFAWNIRLSELGATISKKRRAVIVQMSAGLEKSYSAIAQNAHALHIEYFSKIDENDYGSAMLTQLEKDFVKDLARGFTSAGPHREDIVITIDGAPLQQFASRGETRTTLLALKIQETELLGKATGHRPLLLLDDVFSELDDARRRALTKFIAKYQSFVTTTDADVIHKEFTQKNNLITTTSNL